MYQSNQISTSKRAIALILLVSQLLTSCNHGDCPFKPTAKKWDKNRGEWRCPGGHHPRSESETTRLAREHVNREQAASACSRYQQQRESEQRGRSSGMGQDFFERSAEIRRRGIEKLKELHQEQGKRRQAERAQMEERHQAWQRERAQKEVERERKERERTAREKAEQEEEELRRKRGEDWLREAREGEEDLKREQEEKARQIAERERAIEEKRKNEEESREKMRQEQERQQQQRAEIAQRKKEKLLARVEEQMKKEAHQKEEEQLRLEEEKRAKEAQKAAKKAAKSEAYWKKWDEVREESKKQQEARLEGFRKEREENERKLEQKLEEFKEEMRELQACFFQTPTTKAPPTEQVQVEISKPEESGSMPIPRAPHVKRKCLTLEIPDFSKDDEQYEPYIADLKRRSEEKILPLPSIEINMEPTVIPPPDLSDLDWEPELNLPDLKKEEFPMPPAIEKISVSYSTVEMLTNGKRKAHNKNKKTIDSEELEINKQEDATASTPQEITGEKKKLQATTKPLTAQKQHQEKIEPKKEVEKELNAQAPNTDEENNENANESDIDADADGTYEDIDEEEKLTLKNATLQVTAFLQAVASNSLSTEELKDQGKVLLEQIETLKSKEKELYRWCNRLNMIDSDFDTIRTRMCKKEAQTHLEQTSALRNLRSQLKKACKLTKKELAACKIKVKESTEREEGYESDSSGEEDNYLYSRADLVFRQSAINGAFNALGQAPKKITGDLVALLKNPLTTIEGLATFLEQLPGLVDTTLNFLNSIEGNEKEKGQELGKSITAFAINITISLFTRLPVGIKRIGTLGKAVQKFVEEMKQIEKASKGVKKVKKIQRGGKTIKKNKKRPVGATKPKLNLPEKLKNILKPGGKLIGIQKGKNPLVRTVSKEEAKKIIKQLMKAGAKQVENSRYPGTWYELPGGKGFGIRTKVSQTSLNHGTSNTIDLRPLNLEIIKLKY